MTALTREPSGRRASTIGLDSSRRRPIGAMMRSMTSRTWRLSTNRLVVRSTRPLRSTKTFSCPLTMISVTSVFVQQALERAEAERLFDHLAPDAGRVFRRLDVASRGEEFRGDLLDLIAQFGVFLRVRVRAPGGEKIDPGQDQRVELCFEVVDAAEDREGGAASSPEAGTATAVASRRRAARAGRRSAFPSTGVSCRAFRRRRRRQQRRRSPRSLPELPVAIVRQVGARPRCAGRVRCRCAASLPHSRTSLRTNARRDSGTPKRSMAESIARAAPMPISVGSVIKMILDARAMNGRTVAANGCGASTTMKACSGNRSIERTTDSAVWMKPSS